MDGIQATSRIRRMQPPKSQMPIIALTADALRCAAECYRGLGMDSYLSKPLSPGAMFSAQNELTRLGRPMRSAALDLPDVDGETIRQLRGFLSCAQLDELLGESLADM
jgi:response regulator RpfG family c-di-GMP phosphodiesterase